MKNAQGQTDLGRMGQWTIASGRTEVGGRVEASQEPSEMAQRQADAHGQRRRTGEASEGRLGGPGDEWRQTQGMN